MEGAPTAAGAEISVSDMPIVVAAVPLEVHHGRPPWRWRRAVFTEMATIVKLARRKRALDKEKEALRPLFFVSVLSFAEAALRSASAKGTGHRYFFAAR